MVPLLFIIMAVVELSYFIMPVESFAYQMLVPGQDPGMPNSNGCLDAITPLNGICGAVFEPIASDYFIKVTRYFII